MRAHYIQINQSVDCTLKIFLTVTRYAQTNAFLNDRSGVLLKGNIKRDKVFGEKTVMAQRDMNFPVRMKRNIQGIKGREKRRILIF